MTFAGITIIQAIALFLVGQVEAETRVVTLDHVQQRLDSLGGTEFCQRSVVEATQIEVALVRHQGPEDLQRFLAAYVSQGLSRKLGGAIIP
jgi:hypothetical protein